MKVYKKLMNALAAVEKIVLVISTLLILVLTVGNVFSRKVIHRSWSFTEETICDPDHSPEHCFFRNFI